MTSGMLDQLDCDERRALLASMHRKRFAKGEVLFHEGDPGDTLHLIVKGHVSVRVTTPRGDNAILRMLGPGSLIGEYAAIAPAPRSATVTALDPAETMTLHRDEFARLRAERPSIEHFLLAAAITEVRRLSTALLEALYLPVEQRVLRRLLEIVELYGADDGHVVPIGQADLAGLTGVARQTTNRVLASLQSSGALRLRRGSIEILDLDALRRRAR
jgi:CRP/FNR family transcriptional regulator, cyclic AMP receptor protein